MLMECRVTFMEEPSTRFYPRPPFAPTRIINIIMILLSQGKRLERLTPHPILLMAWNILPTAFLLSTHQ